MLIYVLLVVIIYLLWDMHQDLGDMIDRQRSLKSTIERLSSVVEQLSESAKNHDRSEGSVQIPINCASKTQLRRLPKVGAVIADRIIASRPFPSVDDLANIEGVTPQMMDAIREHVILD